MYCSTGEGSDPDYGPNSKYQTALEPLLLQYDVDLVSAALPSSSSSPQTYPFLLSFVSFIHGVCVYVCVFLIDV